MIKNLKKKAFTLVELLVVIAILAILATAGIVGYTSFTKKAQVSNDNSLVAELNNYISVASVTNDYNTVSEVRDELVNSGIDLSTLTPSAKNHGYYYAFNLKEEKFVLLHDKELAEGYSLAADTKSWDVFVLVKNADDAGAFMNAGYSVYLQNGFEAASLTASKGVDVGENTGITNISYSNAAAEQNVVIRTNSAATTLTINAPADTVKHFGNANVINVTAVATASYHENGSVATLNVKAGKVAVEKDAYVGKVAVASTATSDTGANQVIITNQGTIFDTEVVTYTVNENGSVETEVVESPTGDAAALVNNVTVVDPSSSTLQIGTADALINLANAQVQGLVTGELNIELTANIDLGNKSWVPFGTDKENAFQGTIDGKNHKITNLSYNPNAIIEKYVTSSGTYGAPYGLIAYANKNVTIKNLTISANIDITTQDGQGVGAFIGAYNNSSKTLDSTLYTLELNNCTSQGSISADKKVGGIVGTSFITPTGEYQYRLALATKFINCTNEANIAASGTKAGGISSGVISISAVTPGKDGGVGSFVCTNCVNKGSVIASSSYGAFSGYFSGGDCPTGFDLSSFTDTANVGNHYDCGGGVTVSYGG